MWIFQGSYNCGSCPLGWAGDGKTCSKLDSDICNGNNICHPQASCQVISDTVVCTCPRGMTGDGYGINGCRIAINDPCNPNPCKVWYYSIRQASTIYYNWISIFLEWWNVHKIWQYLYLHLPSINKRSGCIFTCKELWNSRRSLCLESLPQRCNLHIQYDFSHLHLHLPTYFNWPILHSW